MFCGIYIWREIAYSKSDNALTGENGFFSIKRCGITIMRSFISKIVSFVLFFSEHKNIGPCGSEYWFHRFLLYCHVHPTCLPHKSQLARNIIDYYGRFTKWKYLKTITIFILFTLANDTTPISSPTSDNGLVIHKWYTKGKHIITGFLYVPYWGKICFTVN